LLTIGGGLAAYERAEIWVFRRQPLSLGGRSTLKLKRREDAVRSHPIRLTWRAAIAALSFALLVQTLAFADGAFAQSSLGPAAPANPQAPSAQALKNWRSGVTHAPPPQQGCFTLSYPSTQWQQVPCQAGPAHPFLPAHGPQPSTVGDADDVATGVTAGQISLAVGSFDSVSGVTSITSMFGSNDYSLQLNTNVFSTALCSSAGTPASCVGWQQFVYSQAGCTSGQQSDIPCVFIQYWLLGWGSTTCPSGWTFFKNGSDDECFANSSVVTPPQAQPLSNLGNLAVIAEANSGGMDAVIFSTGSALYMVQNNDSMLGLAGGWNSLEYNLVGDCCGSEATINSGAVIFVRVSVDNGGPNPPVCLSPSSFRGFTAETNSLSFAGAPAAEQGTLPALAFVESSGGGGGAPCASAVSLQQSPSLLLASVLPESRSAQVGNTVTAFAVVINAGPNPVAGCSIAPLSGLPGTFTYQTTNPSTNAVTGSPNTPVVIPGNDQDQTFVIAFTPSSAFAPTNSVYSFSCSDVPMAPVVTGLNTLLLSASTTPVPDVIALAATTQNDGIVHVTNGAPPTGAFAVASDNLGSGATITVATNTGGATLPITVTLCQTNPSTGACLQTPSTAVSTTINSNATPTFGIFVSATGTVPFLPATNRIFVTFTDSTNAIRGETSVAVETQ
jgi:hypothetical protein